MSTGEINITAIKTVICRLYGVIPAELLYDSDMNENKMNSFDYDDSDILSDISSDDEYFDFFSCKNPIEKCCFGKEMICFILIDINNTVYGHYHPGIIKSKDNLVHNLSVFLISNGIEIYEKKYNPRDFFMSTSFPEKTLYTVGDGLDWIYKVTNNPFKVSWNESQNQIYTYDRRLMKTADLKRLLIYKCSTYRIHTPSSVSFDI